VKRVPVVDGWFVDEPQPALRGSRCSDCAAIYFPPRASFCRNPDCVGNQFEHITLSRQGKIWSYTDAQYRPPAPYVSATEPYRPFAIVAVELATEQLVVLGQVADGFTVNDLAVGEPVELVIEPLFTDEEHEYLVYRWRPVTTEVSRG
jgi:uncharacterized OB-fold protein